MKASDIRNVADKSVITARAARELRPDATNMLWYSFTPYIHSVLRRLI